MAMELIVCFSFVGYGGLLKKNSDLDAPNIVKFGI